MHVTLQFAASGVESDLSPRYVVVQIDSELWHAVRKSSHANGGRPA